MDYQQFMGLVRRAIDDYQMIDEGDRIAIGISGGKDSLALAMALKGIQVYYPRHFSLSAFTVSLGFPGYDVTPIADWMRSMDIPYSLIETNIASVVFDERKEKNPCSLCAQLRKGALNRYAADHGCNKTALGHHLDDVVETFYLSLFYEGRLHTFQPVTYLTRTGLTVLRPMLYVKEADVIGFANRNHLPVVKNPCPVDGKTERHSFKEQIAEWNKTYGKMTEKTFTAIQNALPEWEITDSLSSRRRKPAK